MVNPLEHPLETQPHVQVSSRVATDNHLDRLNKETIHDQA
jgi:hypothetical protein